MDLLREINESVNVEKEQFTEIDGMFDSIVEGVLNMPEKDLKKKMGIKDKDVIVEDATMAKGDVVIDLSSGTPSLKAVISNDGAKAVISGKDGGKVEVEPEFVGLAVRAKNARIKKMAGDLSAKIAASESKNRKVWVYGEG